MKNYDPGRAPNPEEWLALDEQLRIVLAEEYHRMAKIKLPNHQAHAIFHAIVENQIAEKGEPVVRAMARLTTEGLARHDAIHAIASILVQHMHGLFNTKTSPNESQAVCHAAIERLSARNWRDS